MQWRWRRQPYRGHDHHRRHGDPRSDLTSDSDPFHPSQHQSDSHTREHSRPDGRATDIHAAVNSDIEGRDSDTESFTGSFKHSHRIADTHTESNAGHNAFSDAAERTDHHGVRSCRRGRTIQ